ncbi:MAG TPA: TROVE domain-containing protein [Opitutaceae bacterium]|nr:TROVE domain-containing protein [Lacunisphaera sp.]HWA09105.1 TROVE domain-containing protein [Opitutaceae bacterium]
MAKFSILRPLSRGKSAPNTVNFEGGRAFAQTAKLELVSVLLTTFLEDEFYRTEKQTTEKIRELVTKVGDPRFVAKAALYARNTFGLRSVSHLVAGELAKSVKGARWTKGFYARVVRRPDDVMETLGYYLAVHGRPVPNSLKKGLGAALARFDEHQVAKYRRDHGAFKLVDAVNLVRPKATPALSKLVRGELASAETWETKLTQAGAGRTADQVAAAKSQAWGELVRERKLGYLALLRNVRNILTQAPELVEELRRQLADEHAVRRSLVFPFQFLSAVEVLKQGNLPGAFRVMEALNAAVDHSLANVPKFEGSTLVALDSSGSMAGRPQAIGSLFAATLVKATGADLMLFSDDARYVSLNRHDTTLTAAQGIPFISGCTNFNAIFQRANRAYDRIVILSDMQGWVGGGAPVQPFAAYQRRHRVAPRIYSFDLKGHGTLQFPQERVHCLAGWSDRVFEIMQKLDRDPEALVREVESVPLED